MNEKVCCTCEVVVLLIKPIVFLTFSLSSASLHLKVSKSNVVAVEVVVVVVVEGKQ